MDKGVPIDVADVSSPAGAHKTHWNYRPLDAILVREFSPAESAAVDQQP
ncbi:MAG: hypothetical protein HYW07_08340 [Candidatus Latescibacteria bacterium]|nr:hypothetical protein [Candidatus Latescibacterota bacterium]